MGRYVKSINFQGAKNMDNQFFCVVGYIQRDAAEKKLSIYVSK